MANELSFLLDFMKQNHKAGQLGPFTVELIKTLWDVYKLPALTTEFPISIIDADFGVLGSVIIRDVESYDEELVFKYEEGNYDYVSIRECRDRRILWTDFSNE